MIDVSWAISYDRSVHVVSYLHQPFVQSFYYFGLLKSQCLALTFDWWLCRDFIVVVFINCVRLKYGENHAFIHLQWLGCSVAMMGCSIAMMGCSIAMMGCSIAMMGCSIAMMGCRIAVGCGSAVGLQYCNGLLCCNGLQSCSQYCN